MTKEYIVSLSFDDENPAPIDDEGLGLTVTVENGPREKFLAEADQFDLTFTVTVDD